MRDKVELKPEQNLTYRQVLEALTDHFSVLLVEFGNDATLRAKLIEQINLFVEAPASIRLDSQDTLTPQAILERMKANINDTTFRSAATYLTTIPVSEPSRWQQVRSQVRRVPFLRSLMHLCYAYYLHWATMSEKFASLHSSSAHDHKTE